MFLNGIRKMMDKGRVNKTMRNILFRAKRIDNGEWVYGYYIKTLQDYLTLRTWDLVCFLSGGSYKDGKPYYGILMNDKFVNFVSKLNYPSVCAVGHADEQRLFDMAFDDSLATPSLLGIRLKELYHHYYNNK